MAFPYYNTSSPSPSTKNSITSTATNYGFRDFLLLKNIAPQYPFLSTSINGGPRIGEPVLDTSINNDSNVIPFGLPLETEGILRYNIATLPNTFKNTNQPSLVDVNDITKTNGVFGSIEFPQGIQSYPTSPTQDVEDYGLKNKTKFAKFREKATLYNLYLDTDKQIDVSDYISLQPNIANKQLKGYLDEYGSLNLGDGPSIEIANVIGSVLNGQGLGLSTGGVVNNYDIRASLAGRVLGSAGVINDTKLGMIGAQQLALSLANNAAFNIEQSILGSLNTQDNLLSLVKNGKLSGFRADYKITVPSSAIGKVGNYSSRILGFTIPRSFLNEAGSIFSSENASGNIERANSMILNTGKGQVLALISNVNANLIGTGQYDDPSTTQFRSGYAPGYKDSKGKNAINPNLYAFYNSDNSTIYNFIAQPTKPKNVIPEISYNRSQMIKNYGFLAPEDTFSGPRGNSGYDNRKISDVGFTWTTSEGGLVNSNTEGEFDELPPTFNINGTQVSQKKSLLYKTQKLFNSVGMKTIVSAKGEMNNSSSQIQTANGGGLSKGSGVLSAKNYNLSTGKYVSMSGATADQVFCRSWTTLDRYDYVNRLVRSSGLNTTVPYRRNIINSTLDEYGFPKIAPYSTDNQITDPKKYMFSIENLAWADEFNNLPPVEQGMGDLTTGKKGRIMWFPPYNIQFSETSSVDWESTKFIGRGEPVYTYNNTERSGQLSFSVIVDHPSYINAFRGSNGPEDNYVASFFAGCLDPNSSFSDRLTISEKSDIANSQSSKVQSAVVTPEIAPPDITIYFPNDRYELNSNYENGLSGSSEIDYSINGNGKGFGIGTYQGQVTKNSSGGYSNWNDDYNYGLNAKGPFSKSIDLDGVTVYGINDGILPSAYKKYLSEKCPSCKVEITGYASKQGVTNSNNELVTKRADTIAEFVKKELLIGDGIKTYTEEEKNAKITKKRGTVIDNDCVAKDDAPTDTISCKQARKAVIRFIPDPNSSANNVAKPKPTINSQQQINTRIINRLYDESKYFEQLTDVDKFVFDNFRTKIKHFHPAFHSTTPEGLNSRLTFLHQCTRQGPTLESMGAKNLAFGRAPICILRIGDFYNTKVIIDNLTIDYEPIVWDLNPEGIGVQPMIANINLSIKFIGGSSLLGPINRLQNALSFNYYANTHVYDPRANYIVKSNSSSNEKVTINKDDKFIVMNDVDNPRIKGDMNSFINKTMTLSQSPILINQEKDAENSTGPLTLQGANITPSASTPTISGYDINLDNLNKDVNNWTIGITLKATGVNNDNDKTSLVKKGIKIRITDTLNSFFEVSLSSSFFNGDILVIPKTKLKSGLNSSILYLGGDRISAKNISLQ